MSAESVQANDPCRHSCQNFPGFFRCSCKDGYQLRNNQCQGTKKEKCPLYKGKENQNKLVRCFLFQMLMSVLQGSAIKAVKIPTEVIAASVIKDIDWYQTIDV